MGKKRGGRGGVAKARTLTKNKDIDLLLEEDDDKYLVSSKADDFDNDDERRFLWIKNVGGLVGNRRSYFDDNSNDQGGRLAKHQVNYSATKYIKP